jgi:hypothetical protein
MDIRFLFDADRGLTPQRAAEICGCNLVTAYKWKGGARPTWDNIVKLHTAGILTDDDLRAAGLKIPTAEPKASSSAA